MPAPEITTATLIEKPIADRNEHFDYPTETIQRAHRAVLDFLEANEIKPEEVLFAGYDRSVSKDENTEQRTDSGIPIFHFGNAESLASPDTFDGDEESQEEHWMVNPLRFALRYHTLGIYDKASLNQITGGSIEDGADDEFGTYLYALTTEALEATKLAEITIR